MSVVVGEIPDGTATVIVALVGAAQAAIIALIAHQSSRQKKVERNVREITYQTRMRKRRMRSRGSSTR